VQFGSEHLHFSASIPPPTGNGRRIEIDHASRDDAMPNDALYPMQGDTTIDHAMVFDDDIGNIMGDVQ
jgi:hypothetical protein